MTSDNCLCAEDDAPDAQLITCIQGPSACRERATGRLLDRYTPMVVGSASRACRSVRDGSVQSSDVDAARQGARIGLYDAAQKFDVSRGVPFAGMAGSYVFGAARRELLLQLGWSTDGRSPLLDLLDEFPSERMAAEPSAEDTWMALGLGRVGQVVRHLNEAARALLFHAYVEDLSMTDIAKLRSVRQQTVSVAHKRALATLKAELEKTA